MCKGVNRAGQARFRGSSIAYSLNAATRPIHAAAAEMLPPGQRMRPKRINQWEFMACVNLAAMRPLSYTPWPLVKRRRPVNPTGQTGCSLTGRTIRMSQP